VELGARRTSPLGVIAALIATNLVMSPRPRRAHLPDALQALGIAFRGWNATWTQHGSLWSATRDASFIARPLAGADPTAPVHLARSLPNTDTVASRLLCMMASLLSARRSRPHSQTS